MVVVVVGRHVVDGSHVVVAAGSNVVIPEIFFKYVRSSFSGYVSSACKTVSFELLITVVVSEGNVPAAAAFSCFSTSIAIAEIFFGASGTCSG